MPTPAEVRAQLTDILVTVVECTPDQVRDDARLEDLGVDSLAAVEVADELGRRFGIHLEDATVDTLETVDDAVRAVVEHRPAGRRGRRGPAVAVTLGAAGRERAPGERSLAGRADALWRLAMWFVVAGLVIGGGLGFAGATVVRATGLGGVELPPISGPTAPATPSSSPSASPSPTPSETQEPEEKPTFSVESDRIAAGQRFTISGRFPSLGEGQLLQVQSRDPGADWEDFPVSLQTREGGRFQTQIYTSRPGEREFRVFHEDSDTASPSAKVTIG
ncbi:acyl carrier protein [Aeromicrobium sp.]|uniref:acyl carrier protein n=1 Tax=Aeromicrobium sp. TaxID=1871063 RepID=UPI003515F72A